MTKNYDQQFGPGKVNKWPASLDIAERFLEAAPYAKSSADCLNNYFFSEYLYHLDKHFFDEFPEQEAHKLVEEARKHRQELFEEAKMWPLSCLVASAVYHILSTETEQIHMISDLWRQLLWPLLVFDEPLFDMLRAKGWGEVYRTEIREGFKLQLSFEIGGLTGNRLMWGTDKSQLEKEAKEELREEPWFTCKGFASHIYAEDVLRCLDLVGIDPGLAQSVVKKVFRLQSLTPLYRVLSYKPSSSLPTSFVRRCRDEEGRDGERRGEKEETKSFNKPSVGLEIDLLKLIFGGFLVAGALIASNRLRLSRSNWTLNRPGPYFATLSPGCLGGCLPFSKKGTPNTLGASSSSRPQQQQSEAIASTSEELASTGSSSLKVGWFKKGLPGLFQTRPPHTATRARWRAAEELEELERQQSERRQALQQSLLSHQVSDPSSIGSNNDPAEQLQPGAAVTPKRTVAEEKAYKRNRAMARRKGWVDNRRVLTEKSSKIKAFRKELAEKGKDLPDITSLCVHLHKTTPLVGPEETFFTVQGTLTERWAVDTVIDLIEKHLVVDGSRVKRKPGFQYNCDHVTLKNAGSTTNVRHEKPGEDYSPVVMMTVEGHKKRTSHQRKNKSKFPLDKLVVTLPELFQEPRKLDQDIWRIPEYEDDLLEDDLTPEFLTKQYALGHCWNDVRMRSYMERRGFHSNQAPAFVFHQRVLEISEAAAREFLDSRIPLQPLDAESRVLYSEFTDDQKEGAKQRYFQEVRVYNLPEFSKEIGRCAKLSHTHQLYSESLAGKADGCSEFQTEQHKERKTEFVKRYYKILSEGNIPERDAKKAGKRMLQFAGMKKDGTLRKGPLKKALDEGQLTTEEVREMLAERSCSIELDLRVDTLHNEPGKFKMKMPPNPLLYKKCIEDEARKAALTSPWTQQDSSQWSEAGSSDRGSPSDPVSP